MEVREKQISKRHKTIMVLTAVLIFTAYFALLNQHIWDGFSIRRTYETVGYRQSDWELRRGEELLESGMDLPGYRKLERGRMYTLSAQLTYDGSRDEMPYGFIHVDHLYCRILLDGETLFSCMPEDVDRWDRAHSPGFIFRAFSLPADCKGKVMEIQLLPMLVTSVDYGLPSVEFGDFRSSLHTAVMRDMPHDVVTILCALLGMGAVLFSTVALRGNNYREGISIGTFSLIFSMYMVTECDFNVYFIGNPYFIYMLNYLSFSMLPIALMAFMRERLLEKHRKICTGVIYAEVCFFAVELGAHFGGLMDLRDFIPVVHVIYFAEMALLTFLIHAKKDKKKRRVLVLQVTPVLLGMCVDALVYWMHWGIGVNDATFTIFGVAMFLVIELFRIGKLSVSVYGDSVRSSLYREMAYVDELTGVGNRRAYDKAIDRILSGAKTYESMLVVSADVNKLKYVNDHYGHAAGDNLIRSAARIMKEAVGDRGEIFRTGGDEFSAFLYDVKIPQYEMLIRGGQEKMALFNQENAYTMSLAVGCVKLRNNKILEAVQEADRRMYEDKARNRITRE